MSDTARAMGSFKRHLEDAIGEEAADVVADELVTKSWLRDELARQFAVFRHEMDQRFGSMSLRSDERFDETNRRFDSINMRFDELHRHINRQTYMTVGLVSLVAVLLRFTV